MQTRRKFLAGTTVIALGAIGTTARFQNANAAPTKGGAVKLGVSGGATSDSLDPGGGPDTHLALIWWGIRNSLTEVTEDGQLVGEVAESWDASADAKSWTFKLRKDVEFHNGKSLTPDDVIASINFHRGADSKSGGKVLVDPIKEIKADGPDHVVITLDSGNADFPYLLSDYHLLVMPAKDGKADWQSGIGTGGYVLENFEPGNRANLKRFANYWKGDARAHFDEVQIVNINDATARQSALVSGEVDAIGRVDIKTISYLQQNPDVKVIETTGSQYDTFLMDTTVEPFNNPDVRLAMKYAVDREQMLATILQGHGKIGNDQPIGPTYPYYAPDIEQIKYDPAKAKELLKKAGYDRLSVKLQTSDVAWPAGAIDAAVLYSAQAKAAGIDIEVVRMPNDGYWADVWNVAPFCMGYISGRPTEDWIFTAFYAGDAHYNDTKWKNEKFDAMLKEGRAELDTDKRRAIYRNLQSILKGDGGLIAPIFDNHVIAVGKHIGMNPKISGNWEMDNWRAVERWWRT